MKRFVILAAAAAFLLSGFSFAEAKTKRHHHRHKAAHSHAHKAKAFRAGPSADFVRTGAQIDDRYPAGAGVDVTGQTMGVAPLLPQRGVPNSLSRGEVILLGAPAGCPRTLFCGCALSLKIFGHVVPRLKLALNWLGFPAAAAAPGMVAVGHRRGGGHVFQLLAHVEGAVWRVYDPNSGGHRTRAHDRSIAGLRIVNPRG